MNVLLPCSKVGDDSLSRPVGQLSEKFFERVTYWFRNLKWFWSICNCIQYNNELIYMERFKKSFFCISSKCVPLGNDIDYPKIAFARKLFWQYHCLCSEISHRLYNRSSKNTSNTRCIMKTFETLSFSLIFSIILEHS